MKSSWPRSLERFKFDHHAIEELVREIPGSYKGLDSRALYTSREDFLAIFSHPLVTGTLVDLGCGTGEGCLLYHALYPDRTSIGVDFEESRINAGLQFKEKLGLLGVTLKYQDLLVAPVPEGNTYFLYFPTGMVLDRVLDELYRSYHPFRLVAVESHGDVLPRLMKENWLKVVGEVPLTSERYHPNALIFERQMVERAFDLVPHTISFQEKFLLIEEDTYSWLGESQGLEWTEGERYELILPPRTIQWNQVKDILSFDEVDVRFRRALLIRRLGEVTVKTPSGEFTGHIRKIIVGPTFHLEISSGEKVEWNHIVTITQGSTLCYDSSSV